ncbi:enoyl-CoA hydratase-related protein [Roseomonas sp. NAR14]|uniref:Enoyl-CoA hydratase-related protein n=1 Tax=Roseomonas acroporae TaxID=2937791 RepID=A0A9X1Y914_9PROT|nr:enoyl-CoA hydratase-related protein [Roseomonas acroporae]MCK8785348.1 enoyl-CoA hydratase-related protein [Roseomonas acroporae]
MTESPLLVSHEDGVAHLRFNRPASLNALDQPTAEAFREAVAGLDGTVRAVLLTGAGRAFMAGGDIAVFHRAGPDAPAMIAPVIASMHEALLALAALPAPVIAAVQGAAAGGGFSVAMAADLVIAAEDARFSVAYLRLGTSPDCGGSWMLPRLVGLRRALGMALLDEVVDAATALQLGLVNRVVPVDALQDEALAIARRLAAGPREAIAGTKALLRAATGRDLAAQLDAERDGFLRCAATADFAEGVAAFMGKRPARFGG